MKLGMEFPAEWKEKSDKENMALSDILYGYAVENLLLRISHSSISEKMWLTNEQSIGEQAYKKKAKESLTYVYVEKIGFSKQQEANISYKEIIHVFEQEIVQTQMLSVSHGDGMRWSFSYGERDDGLSILLCSNYMEMQVPITIYIEVAALETQQPKQKELKMMFEGKKTCSYLSYSKENVLSESLFEIMRKLELISNMEVYDTANEIMKSQSISGRHIIEDLKIMGEKEPKVISMKRLEQIASYRDYGYMKKKWQQYVRRHKENADEWEIVIERLLAFMTPLWKALCENEIFFDDWMPELERFLG